MNYQRIIASLILASATFGSIRTDDTPTKTAELTTEEYSNLKQKSFAPGNVAWFTTLAPYPYLLEHRQFEGNSFRLKFAPNLSSLDKNNNFGVVQMTRIGFGSHTQDDFKLAGGRKQIGTLIANALIAARLMPRRFYTEHPLVERYVKKTPMMWQLNNVEELRTFLSSMDKRLQQLNVLAPEKTILVLTLQNDPELQSLTDTDFALLHKYFYLASLEDSAVKEFFEEHYKRMIDENSDLKDPEYPAEVMCEPFMRLAEKACGRFETDKMAGIAIVALSTVLIKDAVWSSMKNWLISNMKDLFPSAQPQPRPQPAV